ncbi:MAG: hypothetical protein U1E05_17330 [Patescibacteria group bacterium]|nr:hypothetical protein [Patescibacteria group bacterium]
MRWIVLFAIAFALLVLTLQNTGQIHTAHVGGTSPGNIACPLAGVVILFIVTVGIAMLSRRD